MKSKTADEKELLASVQFTLPTAQRVLAFAPHPDDEVFGCGGMLALLGSQGCLVSVIVVTDGAVGGDNGAGDLVQIRAGESRKAAGVLGLPDPAFWGLPDRGLAYGELLIERVKTAIAEADADLVLLPSPTELHPDHQALALAGAEAIRRLGGNRRAVFYEINAPLPNPNLVIDITQVFAQKRAAMACFPSQLKEQPYDQRIEGLNRFRSYFLGPQAEAAEACVLLDAASIQSGFFSLFDGPLAHRQRLGLAVSAEDLPLVSVLIRSMDRPTLAHALDSVALQTYLNIEVVVVAASGASHPPLGDVCGPFPLRLVGVAGNEPLSRPRAANIALESARGQWLVFLDDDDLFDPDHVASLVGVVQAHPGAMVAYSGVRVVNTGGTVCGGFNFSYDRRRLMASNFLPMHAVLFSRSLVTEQGVRFDESFDVYEDWDFWMQLSRHTAFIHLDRVTATYQLTGHSGVSATPNEHIIRRGRSRFFSKWLTRWSADEVAEGLRHLEFERDEKGRALARQQEEFERERAGLVQERQQSEQRIRQQFERQLSDLETSLTAILASRSWRITLPLRLFGAFWYGWRRGGLRQGLAAFHAVSAMATPLHDATILTEAQIKALVESGPQFDVVIRGTAEQRQTTRRSLERQRYSRWACVEEGNATPPAEYWLALEGGDELAPDALACLAAAAVAAPRPPLLLSADEIKVDGTPLHKPAWNPDLLWASDYLGRMVAVHRSVAACPAQTEDIAARRWSACLSVASGESVCHLPRLLLQQGESRNVAPERACQVVAEALTRRRLVAEVLPAPEGSGHVRVKWPLPPSPPRVTIIVLTRNGRDFLERCVKSLFEKTAYANFELLIVDNGSDDSTTLAYLERLRQDGRARIVADPRPFNFSALNNHAATLATGEILAFLNDDVEVINDDWLKEMVSQALRPGIGAVGARLWYPDATLQHGGVVLGAGGVAAHAFKGLPRRRTGYMGRAVLHQNWSAVTGACMVMLRQRFVEAGGFDETLAVAFNDIDLCLKLVRSGYRNLWTPYAELYHHESVTRGADDSSREKQRRLADEAAIMRGRWGALLAADPAYNPNFSLANGNFVLQRHPVPLFFS